MKRLFCSFFFFVLLGAVGVLPASAQTLTFSDKLSEYTFELPQPTWKLSLKPTEKDPNPQYIYGERQSGFLQINKTAIKPEQTLSDLIKETDTKLQFKVGYVAGKEEAFAGALRGRVFNYEFVQSGKNMSGRIYFLRADDKTVYLLQFTGARDGLRSIRNQTDSIARTFKIDKAV